MKSRKNKNSAVEILIAENSPTQAEQLAHLLAEQGHAVKIAANGKEALATARRHRPTLVISDVLMPELDGYGLCKAIKSDAKLKDIPVMLVTTFTDPQDVIRGLECGADNFIRKPYDARDLLSRIEHLLMNLDLRKNQKMQVGAEIDLVGQKHFITAKRQQILDMLVSTYEQAILVNNELMLREKQLAHSNQVVNGLSRIAEGLNRAISEREVVEMTLERALELPGIQSGWISLRQGESGFRLAAARNLPPALASPGALEGSCECRRRLLSGKLDSVANIIECERLAKTKGDARGLRCHASVPLWIGNQIVGVMNLAGAENGLFNEEELKVLYSVGNQVAVAMERAKLHEHLGKVVEERTTALKAEVEERRRIQEEQARLVAIIEATPDMVATAGLDGRAIYINSAGLRMLGFEPGLDLSKVRILETHPEWAAKLVAEEGIPRAIEHGTWSGETAFLGHDGREIPISQVIIAHKGPDGSIAYLSTIARDITLAKESEARVMRLNRIYSVLSGINTTIVRVRDRQELFAKACRIAVEHGQFRMAWIGLLDAEGMNMTPVAKAGLEEGYLDQIRLSVSDDAPDGCKLVAQALREMAPVICNDIDTDPRMARWREAALQRGYHSVAVFPLHVGGKAVSVLVLYAAETGFFNEQETMLLTEMAGDISFALEYLEKEAQLNHLAYYDVLTELPNRALFSERLGQALVQANRHQRRVGVVLLDLDRFKQINDSLGHEVGDQFLKVVAERLARCVRDGDTVARLAGDEFALILADMRHEDDAAHVAQNILDSFAQPFHAAGHEFFTSASLGMTLYPLDDHSVEGLLRNADTAMYRAKAAGGNCYQFYAATMTSLAHGRLALENDLRHALERNEFLLHYQPVVSLTSGNIVGVEALIRWQHPVRGLVSPADFIPITEETGLIQHIGEWALRTACGHWQARRAAGLPPLRVAVNVSPRQFQQPDFPDRVAAILQQTGFAPASLDLEITESLLMHSIEATLAILLKLSALGVHFSIDDFGTGYSSLSVLARLPVHTLKIDLAFIKNMTSNPDDLSIVSTIISLAHSLNLDVIAEGVETEDQAKLLKSLKCSKFQGYLFSPAVPIEQIDQFLHEKKLQQR